MVTMNETLTLVLAWAAGAVLGAIFFGGLYWTVRKGVSSTRPTLWFHGSALLRMSIAVGGFYVVSGAQWERLLVCLLGFALARLVVTWLTRSSRASQARPAGEARDAP